MPGDCSTIVQPAGYGGKRSSEGIRGVPRSHLPWPVLGRFDEPDRIATVDTSKITILPSYVLLKGRINQKDD
jgi:hypothetical protein